MEQEDEDIDQLLNEIPRATSAPVPHVDELQRIYGMPSDNCYACYSGSLAQIVSKPYKNKDVYENFYKAYPEYKKLQSTESRMHKNNVALVSNQISSFFSDLTLDSSKPDVYKFRHHGGLRKEHDKLVGQQHDTHPCQDGLPHLAYNSLSDCEDNLAKPKDPLSGPNGIVNACMGSALANYRTLSGSDGVFSCMEPYANLSSEDSAGESLLGRFECPEQFSSTGGQGIGIESLPLDAQCFIRNRNVGGGMAGTIYSNTPQETISAKVVTNTSRTSHFLPRSSSEFYPPYPQHYGSELDMAALVQAQHIQQAILMQRHLQLSQHVEDERRRLKQRMQYILQQQIQEYQVAQKYELKQASFEAAGTPYLSTVKNTAHLPPHSSLGLNRTHQLMAMDVNWVDQQPQHSKNLEAVCMSPMVQICPSYAQGYCKQGDSCPFLHAQGTYQANKRSSNHKESFMTPSSVRIKPGSNCRSISPNVSPGGSRKKGGIDCNGMPYAEISQSLALGNPNPKSFPLELQSYARLVIDENLDLSVSPYSQHQQPKYTSLKEVEGRIYSIAKDQHGCRFLQRKFDEGNAEEIQQIFYEIIDHIVDLMTDPFGNYLIQKLLEVCTEKQRLEILQVVAIADELVKISLNMHGTRAVQKLIETLRMPEQISMVISSLKGGVVTLIKDLNGNHVVQRCLQYLSNEDSQFIYDAAVKNCVDIATHRHGCCVLQRCVDRAQGSQKHQLVAEIAANALVLSQDQYGNYVVQYVLNLNIPWASMEVLTRLEGNFVLLSMQKFSSNVVEKCLKQVEGEGRACIVKELMSSSLLDQLLQDPFANYVIQCALTSAEGALHAGLVDAIRPHLAAIRSSPYGKRILSRINMKK